jgi:hypothetical protein
VKAHLAVAGVKKLGSTTEDQEGIGATRAVHGDKRSRRDALPGRVVEALGELEPHDGSLR